MVRAPKLAVVVGHLMFEPLQPENSMAGSDLRDRALKEVDAVFRLAYYATLSRDRATELVDIAYARALRAANEQDHPSNIRHQLFRELYRAITSSEGDPAQSPLRSAPSIAGYAGEVKPSLDPTSVSQQYPWLESALPGMSFRCRTILVMWAVEGLTAREIADVLQEPLDAVSTRLTRLQRHISRKLGGDNSE